MLSSVIELSLCMLSSFNNLMYCLLCKGSWVRIARKAWWLSHCQIQVDSWHSAFEILHTESLCIVLNSMVVRVKGLRGEHGNIRYTWDHTRSLLWHNPYFHLSPINLKTQIQFKTFWLQFWPNSLFTHTDAACNCMWPSKTSLKKETERHWGQ